MFTVNIQTMNQKNGASPVCEQTIEAYSVRQISEGYNTAYPEKKATPGVLVTLDKNGEQKTHYAAKPADDGTWFRFYVMNETGKTVATYIL